MSMSDERLEILIGKFLDGEISPAEQQRLEQELDGNSEARALLEQLQTLDESSRAALGFRIAPQVGEAERVFERAWRHHEERSRRRVVGIGTRGRLRFAAGLAAGFLLGLVLHFVLVWTGPKPHEPAGWPDGGNRLVHATGQPTGVLPATMRSYPRPVIRNVDWYTFTDDAGNQWLVEGVREGTIRPAAYRGELR